VIEAARKAGIPAVLLGYSGGEQLIVEGLVSLPLAEIRQAHEGWLPSYMDTVE
jgi:phosphoribosylformylglycinamidine synthase